MVYLDASVLVPLYTPEPTSEAVERYVIAADVVALSDLTITEAQNAIIRKGLRGLLTFAEVSQALADIDRHLAELRFHRLAVERRHFQNAVALSRSAPVHLRTLDALHLAVALDCGALEMATDDADLLAAARAVGLRVFAATA